MLRKGGINMEILRVLIADDHPLFRDGLRVLLSSTPDTELVGEATKGEEAVELAEKLQPDLIIMDIQMPGINGIDAIRQILQMTPHILILVVTMFEDDQTVFRAMRAGARGYVVKGSKHSELLRAIQAVGSGETIFSPTIAVRMIDYFNVMRSTNSSIAFPELSQREHEILHLIAQGYKNAEIASSLVLSPKTVRNHITNILSKLQVNDRNEAIIRAREQGMG
jgi:DNA-binding NarL/FixJ family response regulator